jgi:hypothetical protein
MPGIDLTVKLVDEIVKYRKQITIDRIIMAVLIVIVLFVSAAKKQPVIIPGISNKVLEISDIEAPVTIMRFYATIYALQTQNYNEKNYLSHMDMVKSMIAPERTSDYDKEYREFFDLKVSRYSMRSVFELKGDTEIDPMNNIVTIYGTRTSFMGDNKAMQYETKICIKFRKTMSGLFIDNANIEEKAKG